MDGASLVRLIHRFKEYSESSPATRETVKLIARKAPLVREREPVSALFELAVRPDVSLEGIFTAVQTACHSCGLVVEKTPTQDPRGPPKSRAVTPAQTLVRGGLHRHAGDASEEEEEARAVNAAVVSPSFLVARRVETLWLSKVEWKYVLIHIGVSRLSYRWKEGKSGREGGPIVPRVLSVCFFHEGLAESSANTLSTRPGEAQQRSSDTSGTIGLISNAFSGGGRRLSASVSSLGSSLGVSGPSAKDLKIAGDRSSQRMHEFIAATMHALHEASVCIPDLPGFDDSLFTDDTLVSPVAAAAAAKAAAARAAVSSSRQDLRQQQQDVQAMVERRPAEPPLPPPPPSVTATQDAERTASYGSEGRASSPWMHAALGSELAAEEDVVLPSPSAGASDEARTRAPSGGAGDADGNSDPQSSSGGGGGDNDKDDDDDDDDGFQDASDKPTTTDVSESAVLATENEKEQEEEEQNTEESRQRVLQLRDQQRMLRHAQRVQQSVLHAEPVVTRFPLTQAKVFEMLEAGRAPSESFSEVEGGLMGGASGSHSHARAGAGNGDSRGGSPPPQNRKASLGLLQSPKHSQLEHRRRNSKDSAQEDDGRQEVHVCVDPHYIAQLAKRGAQIVLHEAAGTWRPLARTLTTIDQECRSIREILLPTYERLGIPPPPRPRLRLSTPDGLRKPFLDAVLASISPDAKSRRVSRASEASEDDDSTAFRRTAVGGGGAGVAGNGTKTSSFSSSGSGASGDGAGAESGLDSAVEDDMSASASVSASVDSRSNRSSRSSRGDASPSGGGGGGEDDLVDDPREVEEFARITEQLDGDNDQLLLWWVKRVAAEDDVDATIEHTGVTVRESTDSRGGRHAVVDATSDRGRQRRSLSKDYPDSSKHALDEFDDLAVSSSTDAADADDGDGSSSQHAANETSASEKPKKPAPANTKEDDDEDEEEGELLVTVAEAVLSACAAALRRLEKRCDRFAEVQIRQCVRDAQEGIAAMEGYRSQLVRRLCSEVTADEIQREMQSSVQQRLSRAFDAFGTQQKQVQEQRERLLQQERQQQQKQQQQQQQPQDLLDNDDYNGGGSGSGGGSLTLGTGSDAPPGDGTESGSRAMTEVVLAEFQCLLGKVPGRVYFTPSALWFDPAGGNLLASGKKRIYSVHSVLSVEVEELLAGCMLTIQLATLETVHLTVPGRGQVFGYAFTRMIEDLQRYSDDFSTVQV